MKNITVVRALIKSADKILVVKRSNDEKLYKNKYELPGGKPQAGEDLLVALKRELNEELGFNANCSFELFQAFMYVIENDGANVTVIVYRCNVNEQFEPKLSKEHTEYKWVLEKDVKKLDMSKQLRRVIDGKIAEETVEKTTKTTEIKMFTDGGSRGNPGPSALGYVIYDLADNVVKKGSKYLGITTNNQAEYQAVKAGLEDCESLGAQKVTVYMDSQLVANQLNGIYKIKNRDLWPIHESIKSISQRIEQGVEFVYVPREFNKEADAMVNYELDEQGKKSS